MKRTTYSITVIQRRTDTRWDIEEGYASKTAAMKDAKVFVAAGFAVIVDKTHSEVNTTTTTIYSTLNS